MHRPTRLLTVALLAPGLLFSGCAKRQPAGPAPAAASAAAAPSASPAPSAAATAPASPGAAPAAAASSGASPAATATPAPNLLSWKNGTIVREYPADQDNPPNAPDYGYDPDHGTKNPVVWVYELPGVATLTAVGASVPDRTNTGQTSSVAFAVSTTGPDSGFSDVGTITSHATPAPDGSQEQMLPVSARARWVRVTLTSSVTSGPLGAMAVYGTIAPPPANAAFTGTYVQYDNPFSGKTGKFATAPDNGDPWYLTVVSAAPGSINAEQCFARRVGDSFPGTITGRTWNWKDAGEPGTFVVNDEGSLIVQTSGSEPSYWVRTGARPTYCAPQTVGTGPIGVLVLDAVGWQNLYPLSDEDVAKEAPRFRFTRIGASLVSPAVLNGESILIVNGLCDTDRRLTPAQAQMIAQWVAAGHKLLIYDSDMCSERTKYSFLPYQFESDNPGARGAKGDRLILVEDDSLGTSDKSDKAHYLDPAAYAQNDANQLGDANTVTTRDSHWCGHLFGTNANHVNGFMQMYANYGKGVIIYDGFDHDDGGLAPYQRVRMLELEQPIPADLPCTQQASLAFVIEPNSAAKFVPGKPLTLTFPMELLANQGWKGHVELKTSGDFKGRVTPNSFDIAGGTKPLKVAVEIPANAKPGTYDVLVTGNGSSNATAQASIQLTAAVPVVKQFQQKRIRLYGIHFDVDKATIKPQSESVIAEIASVMKQNPSWRFRVEGHTDSDGGYQHNMVLSQQRAESVVNDLVNHYHIARNRLVAQGFGYSRPVAPNTTAAGKALNRRVELVRL